MILEGWRRQGRLVAPLVALLVFVGCKNSDYCCSSEDGCAKAKADGFGDGSRVPCTDPARPFCDDFGLYGAANACIAEPMNVRCREDKDCADSTRKFCVEEACRACRDDSACNVDAPVCTEAYACGDCETGADCAAYAPGRPHCGNDGACVACRGNEDCSGATPVCVGTPAACMACTANEQCTSKVCLTATGACRADDTILYVTTTGSDDGPCTLLAPCKTLRRAVSLVSATRDLVLMAPGMYGATDTGAVAITTAVPFAISGNSASITRSDSGPVMDIRGATTTVTIEGLRIHGAKGALGDAIACAEASVTLRSVTLDGNAHYGVNAAACTLTVERSTIGSAASGAGNTAGGMATSDGKIVVRNSLFIGNGKVSPGGSVFGGASITTPVEGSVIEFCTFADNLAAGVNPAGLTCTVTDDPVSIINSIVVGVATAQIGASCTPRFVLSNQTLDTVGTGNIIGTPTFTNGFHLTPTSAGVDAADPAATLAIDFDGDARPQPAGGRRDIGADEVKP